jgi:hypothetical protein
MHSLAGDQVLRGPIGERQLGFTLPVTTALGHVENERRFQTRLNRACRLACGYIGWRSFGVGILGGQHCGWQDDANQGAGGKHVFISLLHFFDGERRLGPRASWVPYQREYPRNMGVYVIAGISGSQRLGSIC